MSGLLLVAACFDATLPPSLPIRCVVDEDCAITARVCGSEGRCVDDNEPPALAVGTPEPRIASTAITIAVSVAGASGPPIVALDDLQAGARFAEAGDGLFRLDVSSIAEGVHRVVASAADDAGNTVIVEADEPVTVDHTPPTFDIGLVDPSPAAPGENILLTLTFSEPVQPPTAVSADGETIFVSLFDEGDFHVLEAFAPRTDGPFSILVSDVVDLAGNLGGDAIVDGGDVDAVGPGLVSSTLVPGGGRPLEDGLNATTDLEVLVAFDEETSDVEVSVAGIRGDASDVDPGRFRLPVSLLQFEGVAEVVATAVDTFGNRATHVLGSVKMDTIRPRLLGTTATPAGPQAGDLLTFLLTFSEPVTVIAVDADAPLVLVPGEGPSPSVTLSGAIALDATDAAVKPVGFRSITVEDLFGNRAVIDTGRTVQVDPRTCRAGLHDDGEGRCVDEDECAPRFLLSAGDCILADNVTLAEDVAGAVPLPGSSILALGIRNGTFSMDLTKPDCDMFVAVELEFATVGAWDGAVTFDAGELVGPDELKVLLRSTPQYVASFSTRADREQSFPLPSGTAAFSAFEGAREIIPPVGVGGRPVGRYRLRLRLRDVGDTEGERVPVSIAAAPGLDWRLEAMRVAAVPIGDGPSIACNVP